MRNTTKPEHPAFLGIATLAMSRIQPEMGIILNCDTNAGGGTAIIG